MPYPNEQKKSKEHQRDPISYWKVNGHLPFPPKASKLAQPIIKLLKKSIKFVWDDQCQIKFERLKQILTFSLILHKLDASRPLLFYISATKDAINAFLAQEVDNE